MTKVNELQNMVGRTMVSVRGGVGDDELVFEASDGSVFEFRYYADCCATCTVEDIIGDIADLMHSPIVLAEEVSEDEPYAGSDSYTWTFYRFATVKGTVTVRWLGESNGYYSESVTYEERLAS